MYMKADSTMVILAIFAVLAGAMVLMLLIPKIAEPSMKVHGNQQAYVLAKMLASSINALSYADEGEITKTFDADWDVIVRCGSDTCNIKVSYGNRGSDEIGSVVVTKNVEPFTGNLVRKIKMTKTGDEPVKLEGIKADST